MASHSLLNLNLNSIDSELESALSGSLMNLNSTSYNNIDFWAQTDLRQNVENSISKWAGNMQTLDQGNFAPPGDGFKVTVGLQVLIGYKVRFKANVNLGYQKRWDNFATNASLHFSAYNGGLGTPVNSKDLVFDVTAAANVIVGGGRGTPLQSYALNYNTPIPNLNDFENSIRYGQLLTYNSALNENKFSLDQLQREGMFGFRIGNVNVSTNNDTARLPYRGGGTDMGWTGGISVVTPLMEVGFQDFTGTHSENDDMLRDSLLSKIKNAKNEFEKAALENQLKKLTDSRYHTQTPYQKRLNKVSTYFRFNKDGINGTFEVIGDAWLQKGIHKAIKDFRFEYDFKNVELWGGKNF